MQYCGAASLEGRRVPFTVNGNFKLRLAMGMFFFLIYKFYGKLQIFYCVEGKTIIYYASINLVRLCVCVCVCVPHTHTSKYTTYIARGKCTRKRVTRFERFSVFITCCAQYLDQRCIIMTLSYH